MAYVEMKCIVCRVWQSSCEMYQGQNCRNRACGRVSGRYLGCGFRVFFDAFLVMSFKCLVDTFDVGLG